jgi:hypothetical protein
MAQFDSALPTPFVRNYLEANPSYRPGLNEETDALFNPSISAVPLHIPQAMRIKKHLNTDMWFYWAFDRCGQNPNHTRVEQLRAVGFDYATTADVEMYVDDAVKGKDAKGFSNEIRNGDNRLMKVKKERWFQIRKSHMMQAIGMANPRGKAMGDDGTIMGVNSMLPGLNTRVTDEPIEDIRARATVSNAAQDIADGTIRGNASVVPKDSVNKGR